MDNWNPCVDNKHSWVEKSERVFECVICGIKGWSREYVPRKGFSTSSVIRVYPYKCPSCGGVTVGPRSACPKCISDNSNDLGSSVNMKVPGCPFSWSSLTSSQRDFLMFLFEKGCPVCVSRRRGGGNAQALLGKGLIEKGGFSSGQVKWVLSSAGKKLVSCNLETVG